MPWPIAGAIIGSTLLGGAMGAASAQSSQKRSIAAQKDIAQNQYTWAVDDLKRAGLNPILAAQGGLHGSSASAPPAPVGVTSSIDLAGSALNIKRAVESTKKAENIVQDTMLKLKQTEHEGSKIAETNMRTKMFHQKTREARQNVIKLVTEINSLNVGIDKMESEVKLQHAQKALVGKQTAQIDESKRLLVEQYKMLRAQMPKAEKLGEVYSTWYGNMLGYIEATMRAFGINTAAIVPMKGFGK